MNIGRLMRLLGPVPGRDIRLQQLLSEIDELELKLAGSRLQISELEEKSRAHEELVNRSRILFTQLEEERLILIEVSDYLLKGQADLFWRFNECLIEAANRFLEATVLTNHNG